MPRCRCFPGWTGFLCDVAPPALAQLFGQETPTEPGFEGFWRTRRWSECSTKCGGGLRNRTVFCAPLAGMVDRSIDLDSAMLPEGFCDPTAVPADVDVCNPQPCGGNVTRANLRLAGLDYSDYTLSGEMRDQLEDNLARELAEVLNMDPEDISVDNLRNGSIIAEFSIRPKGDDSAVELEERLTDMVRNPESPIYTETTLLRQTDA